MTLTVFIKTYLGKRIDYTDENFKGDKSFQCVDLYRQYIHDVYGIEQTPSVIGAKDIFEKHGELKTIPENVLADYSRGDILIWGKSNTNVYGHVAILVDVYNTKYFVVLEQDGFKQDGVKLAFRSRENLIGCLYK